jgi:hypothetical protein
MSACIHKVFTRISENRVLVETQCDSIDDRYRLYLRKKFLGFNVWKHTVSLDEYDTLLKLDDNHHKFSGFFDLGDEVGVKNCLNESTVYHLSYNEDPDKECCGTVENKTATKSTKTTKSTKPTKVTKKR